MFESCMVIPSSQSSFRIEVEHNLEFAESFLSLPNIGVEYDKMSISHHPFSVEAFKVMSCLSMVGPKTVAD